MPCSILTELEHDRARLLAARSAFAEALRLVDRQLDHKFYLSAGSSLAHVEMKLEVAGGRDPEPRLSP